METLKEVEYVIIGAGIIGLAIAQELTLAGKEVLVLEKNSKVGEEVAYRNSAVLHAGFYYPSNSLKARFCKQGQSLLYGYCRSNNIPFKQTGKLLVITSKTQKKTLKQIAQRAMENNIILEPIGKKDISILEPALTALEGLYSPSTGVIDGLALQIAFQINVQKAGGFIAYQEPFLKANMQRRKFLIQTTKRMILCKYLINAAGLWATEVARSIAAIPKESIPQQYFAKGNYFKLHGSNPFNHLIYPLPNRAGLGIHATVNLKGETRFGPDVEWVKKIDYKASVTRANIFYKAIRKYYPDLEENTLLPDVAGIRSKIKPSRDQPQDFLIQDHRHHGIKNIINLYGIESPGLTSSMAIAHYIMQLLI